MPVQKIMGGGSSPRTTTVVRGGGAAAGANATSVVGDGVPGSVTAAATTTTTASHVDVSDAVAAAGRGGPVMISQQLPMLLHVSRVSDDLASTSTSTWHLPDADWQLTAGGGAQDGCSEAHGEAREGASWAQGHRSVRLSGGSYYPTRVARAGCKLCVLHAWLHHVYSALCVPYAYCHFLHTVVHLTLLF